MVISRVALSFALLCSMTTSVVATVGLLPAAGYVVGAVVAGEALHKRNLTELDAAARGKSDDSLGKTAANFSINWANVAVGSLVLSVAKGDVCLKSISIDAAKSIIAGFVADHKIVLNLLEKTPGLRGIFFHPDDKDRKATIAGGNRFGVTLAAVNALWNAAGSCGTRALARTNKQKPAPKVAVQPRSKWF